MPDFDPYHRWLGIPPDERPTSKYRLLALSEFESDTDVIKSAAERQTVYLRTMQAGEHANLVAQLLNEVSEARVTLLDPEKKSDYDAQLRNTRTPKQAQPTPVPAPVVQPTAPAVNLPPPLPATPPLSPRDLSGTTISTPHITPDRYTVRTRSTKRRAKNSIVKLGGVTVLISGAIVSLIIALSKDEPSNIPKLTVDDYRSLQQDGDVWSGERGMSSADQQELDTLVEKAKAASESGDYEQADLLFERAFAIGGLNSDAEMGTLYYQHGRSLKERGLLEDALVKFRLANSIAGPATRLAESKEEEGMVLFELGSVSE